MARYLSSEWIEAVDAAARADAELTAACSESDLVLGQHITGGPDGDITYTVTLGPDGARVTAGDAESSHVSLNQRHDTAMAIRDGTLNALDALQAGLVEIRGDAARLRDHREVLVLLERSFSGVSVTRTP